MNYLCDYLYYVITQHRLLFIGIVLVLAGLLFFVLRKKKARIIVLAAMALLLGATFFVRENDVPVLINEGTAEAHWEYRFPGGTEAFAVASMEQFLRRHYGTEAKRFDRMTFRRDWRFQYKGVKTDYVFSFRIEKGDTVISDNTGGADLSQIKDKINAFLACYEKTNTAKKDAVWMQKREAYLSTEAGSIRDHHTVGSLFYCSRDGRFYALMQYDVVNDDGWCAARDVYFLINDDGSYGEGEALFPGPVD